GRAARGRARGAARGRGLDPDAGTVRVTSVEVVAAGEEPGPDPALSPLPPDEGTAADWLPGIRDEHEDDGGWQARWLERPTWDRRVTPNVIRRTGTRPRRRR
ncbi:MAG TPA: hypothetical protein VK592_01075, partial [Candidatus Dormibacteraeota bacterium]|nr:hypothetical protein [Candidatus Dormibacteraeota bacterium]